MELNDEDAKNEIYNNAKSLNLVEVRSNIETRYDDLGLSLVVPDFEKYVNDIWKIQCTITSPSDNEQINYNDSIIIDIDDFASYINIVNTKYYLDGQLIVDDNEYNYQNSFKLQDLSFGNHILKAVATDDSSNIYVDSINIILNTPDQFTLISPQINTVYSINDTIEINISDQPNYIDIINVKYYLNDQLIGDISNFPFNLSYVVTDSSTIGKNYIRSTISDETGRTQTDSVLTTVIVEIPDMAFVLGGTFEMGDHFNEGEADELPLHSVTLNDYYIGKYELTRIEWAAFMPDPFGTNSDSSPIRSIDWHDMIKYCNLRSISEGLTPCYSISGSTNPANWGTPGTTWDSVVCDWNANGYRLPTEAEWEYAARGGINCLNNYRYSGSNLLSEVGWFSTNSLGFLYQVGLKLPNLLGIYDMCGNVTEMCWDWYSPYPSTDQFNPTGPSNGSTKVCRGGWFNSTAAECRVSYRNFSTSTSMNYGFKGFRIARKP